MNVSQYASQLADYVSQDLLPVKESLPRLSKIEKVKMRYNNLYFSIKSGDKFPQILESEESLILEASFDEMCERIKEYLSHHSATNYFEFKVAEKGCLYFGHTFMQGKKCFLRLYAIDMPFAKLKVLCEDGEGGFNKRYKSALEIEKIISA